VRQNRGSFSDFVAFCHAGPFLGQDLEFYDKLRGGAGGERQLVLLVTELFELDGGSLARVDLLLVEHGQIAADLSGNSHNGIHRCLQLAISPQDLYGALAYHNAGRHGVAGDPQDIKRRPLGTVASQADRFGPEPSLSHHFECNCEDEDGT
jgi:hypothetical protein